MKTGYIYTFSSFISLCSSSLKTLEAYFSIAVVFHRIVYFIYFMRKHIKLRDDEFPPEGLNQQHNVSADAPGRTIMERSTQGYSSEMKSILCCAVLFFYIYIILVFSQWQFYLLKFLLTVKTKPFCSV